jgi:hypothetical protein
MGRPPKAATAQDESPVEASPKMVLKKNHGLLIQGRVNKFYPAGSEFDFETDAALISALVQSGAVFE